MSPTIPSKKKLPDQTRRPTKNSEQVQALLASERMKTAKMNARRDLKLRRARQQAEWESQVPVTSHHPSPVRASQPLPNSKGKAQDYESSGRNANPSIHQSANFIGKPASPPSTTHATVNASIGAGAQGATDKTLQGVLQEEHEWKEQLAWFAKNYPTRNVSSLDTEELVQLRRELGPGPTLPRDHNPYPNVRVELQPPPPLPRTSNGSFSNHLSQANSKGHGALADISIEEELGVNSSFDHPQMRAKVSAILAQPLPTSRPPAQSQPVLQSICSNNNQKDYPPIRQMLSQPSHTTAPHQHPAPVNRHVPDPSHNPGHRSATPRRPLPTRSQHTAQSSSNQLLLSFRRTHLVHADVPLARVPSPLPWPVPCTREPPTAAALGLSKEPADFERIIQFIDDSMRGRDPEKKPTRSEWRGLTLQIVDRAAEDSKATLIAAGYMKGAEDRELIILQAWDRACEWYHVHRPYPKIQPRQIQYIQNLFPSCRKLMKTRLEQLVIADYELRKGTVDEIKARVIDLLLHGFHSVPPDAVNGTLHFEHNTISFAIAEMIFRGPRDLGVTFNVLFNPIPPRLVALACAMIADIIGEYSSGEHCRKATYVETLRPLFNTYIGSLKNLRDAHADRYRNLLMRLHDECITSSGAMREADEEPDNIIPIEAFDAHPVDPYEPRYAPEQILAMLTKDHVVDDDQHSQSSHDRELGPEDFEMDNRDYGEPGPGHSTIRNRELACASDEEEYDWGAFKSGNGWGDDGGESDDVGGC